MMRSALETFTPQATANMAGRMPTAPTQYPAYAELGRLASAMMRAIEKKKRITPKAMCRRWTALGGVKLGSSQQHMVVVVAVVVATAAECVIV